MKSISDGWQSHRATLARVELDAIARREVERAYYAGAEHMVDAMVDMNDAGLTLPFVFERQLSLWTAEYSAHQNHLTREGNR